MREATRYPATYARAAALASLAAIDGGHAPSRVGGLLARPENEHLLAYVSQETFTHVFPGHDATTPARFFLDLDRELRSAGTFHLWAMIPLCRYKCHFCQFPILVTSSDPSRAEEAGRRWVDASIAEARLWLQAVPALREVPVGEFCLFGGTPSVLPARELDRLMRFYRENLNLDGALLRAEGTPDSLTAPMLRGLNHAGFDILTYGIQTFDDQLLAVANRRHTGAQSAETLRTAREIGFTRVDADLVYGLPGLPGQTVDGFLGDVDRMVELGFDTVVMIKLHLRSAEEVDHAVASVAPTAWQDPAARARLEVRWKEPGDWRQRLRTWVETTGFAHFQADPPENGTECLAGLGLGTPFVPPVYGPGRPAGDGLTRISAAPRPEGLQATTSSFERRTEDRFHTDGTLQEIGHVATTVLFCERPARSGGESLLFNSTGAFSDLAAEDPGAARSLLWAGCLERRVTADGRTETRTGPAFGLVGGQVVTRYSVTPIDRFQARPGEEAALARALAFLDEASRPGSRHHVELRLAAGQGLFIANSRISHGRTAFEDDPRSPRCLYRALFLRAVTGAPA